MFEIFTSTLSPLMVVFLYMITGFVLNKAKLVPENTGTVLSRLETCIFMPALIISTFSTQCSVESLKKYYPFILYSILALTCAFIISMLLAPFFEKNDAHKKNIYRYSLIFANFGFLGNAVVPMIFGAEDPQILYKYMIFTLPMQIMVCVWGIATLIPESQGRTSIISRLNNPTFYSVIIGIILGLSNSANYLPEFVTQTLSSLGTCMAPIAMVLTGFILGGYSLSSLLFNKKVYIVTILRLFILPVIILTILYLAGASRSVMILALFAYASPLGINTVIFPSAYGGEVHTGASMAMISHFLCLITIPLMYTLFTAFIR